ncbi:class I SAM-dependent methyltransferase [Streptomyces meridianus]|uniref:Class I SAM-dependent methyltransferase n=1 Tax=Streptomyces meridianus TaxID=2938945 RepID=A0ABT0X5B4_9ACTN|nr:class I SAM-dependent methyltransferase [Streptomyces meridianus]MCM2577731.1 class I SAM-dependent methyltransferase [Streptomyces meridianus]
MRRPTGPDGSGSLGEDGDSIPGFVAGEVGDVTGRSLLHLTCGTGHEALAWARRGAAQVVGVDASESAVDLARDLAADLGMPPERAAFVVADVYDAAVAVPDLSYDVVLSAPGSLSGLPDVERWAETAAALVAPGGFLHLAEVHPLTAVLDEPVSPPGAPPPEDLADGAQWTAETHGAEVLGATTDFDDGPRDGGPGLRRQHSVAEVVSAVAAAGLRIDFLHEHDAGPYRILECLRHDEDGLFRLPPDRPAVP